MRAVISQATFRRANRWKLVGLISLLVFLFVVMVAVDNMLLSSIVAFVVSYSLGPLVSYIERQGISRTVAASAVFAAVGLVIGLLILWLVPYLGQTLSGLQADMPRFILGVGQYISEIEEKLRSIAGPLSDFDLTSKVETQLTLWTHNFFDQLPTVLKTSLTVMLLGPFLAFFMIKDGRTLSRTIMSLVPNPLFETALNLLHQINFQIGQFVRARIIESLIVGLITAGGLYLLHMPYWILLGVIAGVTNFIPYLGPILGAVPALLIAVVNGLPPIEISLVALVYVVAQAIDAGVLIPLLVAKIVDLHPVTVIVVIIAGAQLMGILGMIISIPVASTLKVTISTIYRHLIDTRS